MHPKVKRKNQKLFLKKVEMTTSCLFRPQLKCLVENGPTVIGCKITIVSEKRSGIFGPDDKGCPDRFEVAIDALGGPVEMVLVFDYSHPYSAPDIIVVRDGFSESHGEDYIDYYALESLKLWNLGDASALTRVMKEVMVLRTKRNLGLVKNLVLPSIQVLKEFNEMFGFVPFDVAPNVDGTVCFKYTHKLDYAKDNGGSIPVCFITWKLDPSKPDEPTETKVTLFNVSEAMKTALSGLTVSNYNCATSFKAWLASVDEKFKRTVSKVNSRKEYLREFSKVFNSPLYFNPPKYNVIAFGISEPTYHNPSILKSTSETASVYSLKFHLFLLFVFQ